MYLPRTLEQFVQGAAQQFPVLLVTGARQVGKTTFLRHLSEQGRTYVTLDDPLLLDLARRDPALFLQRFRPPLLIDEIQYAPQLLPYIKMEVDRNRVGGAFWLTGSQQFHLMRGVSESLAGRVAVVNLLGFSRRELMRQSEIARPFLPTASQVEARLLSGGRLRLRELYHLIWRGSFPAIALNQKMDRDLFYSSYLQTYLQRDVRDLARVGDEAAFLRLLRIAAARTAQMLNVSEFARDADIAVNTAKAWLSILQASGTVYILEPYYTNLSKRLIKRPKLYFLDTGLCAYLTAWSSPATLEAGAMSGAILETWVLSELLKSYWHNGRHAPFFYYRDKDQKEIDLLVLEDQRIYPLEFKKTASPSPADARVFQTLAKLDVPPGPGGVICLTERSLPLSPSAMSIPVSAL
jgi:predicted AAA+ superfamily ATPase